MFDISDVRQFTPDDFPQVRRLVDKSEALDKHTDYTYWVAHHHWPELFLVAAHGHEIAGFVMGIEHSRSDRTVFLWQIGVDAAFRRQGIAMRLANAFVLNCRNAEIENIRLTISPGNRASKALFDRVARENGLALRAAGSTGSLGGVMHPETVYHMETHRPSQR